MGKKHLLYIHHPNFSGEKHKSALVNSLLNQHYDGVKPAEPLYTNPPVVVQEPEVYKFCKHGMVYGFCKKGCKL